MPNKNNNYESKSNLIKKPKSFSGNRNSRSDKTARGKFGNNYSTNRNSSNNKDSFNDKGSFIKKDDRSFSNDRNYSKNTNSFNDRSSFRKKDDRSFSNDRNYSKNTNSFNDRSSFRKKDDRSFSNDRNYSKNTNSFNDRSSFRKKDDRSFSNDRNYSKNTNSFNDRSSFRKKDDRSFSNDRNYSKNTNSFNDRSSFRKKDDRSFSNDRNYSKNTNSFNDRSSFRKKDNRKNSSYVNHKKKEKIEPKISLEYVLNYFNKHEVVDINEAQDQFPDDLSDTFFSKVNLLINKHIIEIAGDNKLKLNSSYLNNSLCEYSYIKIKTPLLGNHYMVSISPLNKKESVVEEIIIENIKDNLKDRIILVKLSLVEEKLIAYPIFYLNDISNEEIKQIDKGNSIKGIYQNYDNVDVIVPLNIKSRKNIPLFDIPKNLEIGVIIEAKLTSKNEDYPEANFIKTISTDKSAISSSMLSVYQYDLPHKFSSEILDIAKQFKITPLKNRQDIRHIPLVTIDDDDAKDFDDAIYAEKIEDRENTYKIYVAIADVAHYVKPKDSIDKEAQLRGNSVYLPGFVIPMLPKELSNGWCSLNPNEDRGCLVMEGIINRNGELENFEFYRGLMKSHARLTYSEVANALDGEISEQLQPLMKTIINPLKKAFLLLNTARKKRSALEITSKESKFILDENENILDIKTRESLISHKIVEEFMILANVAAANFIAQKGLSKSGLAVYRIHVKPSVEKIMNFTNTLKSFGLNIKAPDNVSSTFFNNLIKEFAGKDIFNPLNEAILRCQSQAEYKNENIGHFGLALKEYCHFTSPIRRYSDLMIHRLILSLIEDENFNYSANEVSNIAEFISLTERRAFNAEKSAKNRVSAKWLSSKIGESFLSEVSSITNAGMFVNLLDNGASGLIPMRTISRGFADVDLNKNIIKDKKAHRTFTLGNKIPVIIKEADEIRGMLTFLIDEDEIQNKSKKKFK